MNADTYPAVTINYGLGEVIDYFDVDYSTLVGYMRERGFSDEQIRATHIEIRNEVLPSKYTKDSDRPLFTLGGYNPESQKVYLFPRPDLGSGVGATKEHECYEFMQAIMTSLTSGKFSTILAHELEHHAENINGLKNALAAVAFSAHADGVAVVSSVETLDDLAPQKSAHQQYLDSPEEVRCRDAQEKAPRNLVTFQPK